MVNLTRRESRPVIVGEVLFDGFSDGVEQTDLPGNSDHAEQCKCVSCCAGFLKHTDAPFYLDLNLRDPWWSATILSRSLMRAFWIRMNRAELEVVARQVDCSGKGLEESARYSPNCKPELLIVSLRENGEGHIGGRATRYQWFPLRRWLWPTRSGPKTHLSPF